MIDVSVNPRVTQILARIERAEKQSGSEQEVEALLRELGGYVRWLTEQDPAARGRIQAESEVWVASHAGTPSAPEVPAGVQFATTLKDKRRQAAVPARPKRRDMKVQPVRVAQVVAAAVRALGEPDVPKTDDAYQTAALGVFQAISDMEHKWPVLPASAAQGLIGLVASRIRQLQHFRGPDEKLERVMLRLVQVHTQCGLPTISALLPQGKPEFGSWSGDARRWRAELRQHL